MYFTVCKNAINELYFRDDGRFNKVCHWLTVAFDCSSITQSNVSLEKLKFDIKTGPGTFFLCLATPLVEH